MNTANHRVLCVMRVERKDREMEELRKDHDPGADTHRRL